MNEKCFQFYLENSGTGKENAEDNNSELVIKAAEESNKVIDDLLSPWNMSTKKFLNSLSISCRRQNIWPWAIALFEKEFDLAGHVVSTRKQKKDFAFGSYSLESGQYSVNDGVPPFSFLLISEKGVLADAAKKSLLFEQAWNLLKDKDEGLNWICIPSTPPDEWVKKESKGNDKRFMTAIKKVSPLLPISTLESPRKVIAKDFVVSLDGELPISGGWGYTKEDACIINKNDPVVDPVLPFDGIGIEYVFVEKRIYEEMIILRASGDKFSGISWNLKKQELLEENDRHFDKLVYEITAFGDYDWQELKAEFEGPKGKGHPDFDEEEHEKKRQERMFRLTREFWFDITSFFGQGTKQ